MRLGERGEDPGNLPGVHRLGVRGPWQGFGAHKNLCLSRTSRPWVLSLDADERVTPELRAPIERILESGGDCDGYYIPRKNLFLGK